MTRSTERATVTTPPTTELDETSTLRHQLIDQLADAGHIRTPAVDNALRTVAPHAFAPRSTGPEGVRQRHHRHPP
ncbi:hypothetical protein [Streptomyces sp. NPDC097610]|uniref:hypothetical protein n=1 Tax=Streptomyces sp. NPDC097610 TaxID=3157227 RepID=UPI003325C132